VAWHSTVTARVYNARRRLVTPGATLSRGVDDEGRWLLPLLPGRIGAAHRGRDLLQGLVGWQDCGAGQPRGPLLTDKTAASPR
jgi:hypothetical protein